MSRAFQAQFERSGPTTPPATRTTTAIDGAAALRRFTEGGAAVDSMTGKEMYAIVEMLKSERGSAAHELENSLLRIKRQLDKKIALLAWVSDNVAPIAQKPPLGDRTNLSGQTGSILCTTTSPSPLNHKTELGKTIGADTQTSSFGSLDENAMMQLLNDFATGREHLSMSGCEMFHLIGWLKARGHADIEDEVMRIRLQGDKKMKLCNYIRRHWTPQESVQGAPQSTGNYAPVQDLYEPGFQQQNIAGGALHGQQAFEEKFNQLVDPAEPSISPMDSLLNDSAGSVQHQVAAMESTIARMEESFAFAIECMQSDMAQARAQLQKLKLAVHTTSR